MSDELIFILSVFAGIPIYLAGWSISIIAAKRLNTRWVPDMVFALPVTLPILALVHWQHAKLPFLVSSIDPALVLTAGYYFGQDDA
jgi:hypothetical protein